MSEQNTNLRAKVVAVVPMLGEDGLNLGGRCEDGLHHFAFIKIKKTTRREHVRLNQEVCAVMDFLLFFSLFNDSRGHWCFQVLDSGYNTLICISIIYIYIFIYIYSSSCFQPGISDKSLAGAARVDLRASPEPGRHRQAWARSSAKLPSINSTTCLPMHGSSLNECL